MKNYELISEDERFSNGRMQAVSVLYRCNEDGEELNHTIIRSNPSVATIVISERGEIALIRQFRTTTGKWYWEIPAGCARDGEDILDTARREVEEETGLVVKDVMLVTKSSNLLDPSKSDEDYGVAVAKPKGVTSRHLDDQEAIDDSVVWMPMDEVYSRLHYQMAMGEPFLDGLEMSGHSMYALLAYRFLYKI